MLGSKYFWIALIIFIPFVTIWIMEGFGWAIATLIIFGGLLFYIRISSGRRRRRYYYYDDDDVIIERQTQRSSSSIKRGMDWHVPKVNKKGAEFISGSGGLKRHQQEEMKRIKKNLWG